MAGCKGAKKLLAINPDAEASIFASADYAVIGDLHEVVPAISAEIRKARGGIASSIAAAGARCALIVVSGTLFIRRVRLLVGSCRRRADPALGATLPRRARNEATIVLGQRKLLQRLVPGLMHAFIFWGFLVLAPDDPDRDDRDRRQARDAAVARRTRAGTRCSSTSSACSCSSE